MMHHHHHNHHHNCYRHHHHHHHSSHQDDILTQSFQEFFVFLVSRANCKGIYQNESLKRNSDKKVAIITSWQLNISVHALSRVFEKGEKVTCDTVNFFQFGAFYNQLTITTTTTKFSGFLKFYLFV